MNLHIQDRVALVCGSSSGLGLAIATQLAREGCRVALNGRDTDRLSEAADSVERDTRSRPHSFAADVSDHDAAIGLVADVAGTLGAVDILVPNAGGPPARTFEEASSEEWQHALELNLLSTIRLCQAAIPGMMERKWGRVTCLTSVAAKQPIPGLLLSATARAGVLGFVKSVSNEVAAHGVTVNTICPGYMRTERVKELFKVMAEKRASTVQEIERDLVAQIPAGRIGDPDELAAAVAFLSSEQAAYINGAAIQVDGGYIRGIL